MAHLPRRIKKGKTIYNGREQYIHSRCFCAPIGEECVQAKNTLVYIRYFAVLQYTSRTLY